MRIVAFSLEGAALLYHQAMADTTHNLPEYSVSELSFALKRTVEQAYDRVRVRGEISGFKRAASGHLYLMLKDAEACLDAVCWRTTAARLGIKPEDGMEVICTGKLTTYPGRSKYQMIVDQMELAGEGALLKLIEDRRKRLLAEGLFDESRKKPIPVLPGVIGVVTSPTGAVIRDILHRLSDRFPRHVLVWPVLVQGEGAAQLVAAAIQGFNRIQPGGPVPRPDLLIVARGGGSLEDLMAFNDEAVVRAAAASVIPLISGVGHETDTTLIDFAADWRAPTPTAAAERAVPVRAELATRVAGSQVRLLGAMQRWLEEQRRAVQGLGRGLGDPGQLLGAAAQRLDDRVERLKLALPRFLAERRAQVGGLAVRLLSPRELVRGERHRLEILLQRLAAAEGRLSTERERRLDRAVAHLRPQPLQAAMAEKGRAIETLASRLARSTGHRLDVAGADLGRVGQLLESFSYERVLERGFVLVRDRSGHPVTESAELKAGERITLRFADGERGAVADGEGKRRKPLEKADQGSLL
jgi:exodeoxyribonuclease VII large subunit